MATARELLKYAAGLTGLPGSPQMKPSPGGINFDEPGAAPDWMHAAAKPQQLQASGDLQTTGTNSYGGAPAAQPKPPAPAQSQYQHVFDDPKVQAQAPARTQSPQETTWATRYNESADLQAQRRALDPATISGGAPKDEPQIHYQGATPNVGGWGNPGGDASGMQLSGGTSPQSYSPPATPLKSWSQLQQEDSAKNNQARQNWQTRELRPEEYAKQHAWENAGNALGRGDYGQAAGLAGERVGAGASSLAGTASQLTPTPVKEGLRTAGHIVGDASARMPKTLLGGYEGLVGGAQYLGGKAMQGVAYPLQAYAQSQGTTSPTYEGAKGFADAKGQTAGAGWGDVGGAFTLEPGEHSRVKGTYAEQQRGAPAWQRTATNVAATVGSEAASLYAAGGLGALGHGAKIPAELATAGEGLIEGGRGIGAFGRAMNAAGRGVAAATPTVAHGGHLAHQMQEGVRAADNLVNNNRSANWVARSATSLLPHGSAVRALGTAAQRMSEEPAGEPAHEAEGATAVGAAQHPFPVHTAPPAPQHTQPPVPYVKSSAYLLKMALGLLPKAKKKLALPTPAGADVDKLVDEARQQYIAMGMTPDDIERTLYTDIGIPDYIPRQEQPA